MRNSGSKESGSNCERNKSTGQARKKGKGTQRQTKRRPKGEKTAENEKEKPKGKKIKSSSTTTSTDNNKSSDKNHSKGSPDKDYNDETSNVSTNAKSSDLSKEDTRSPNLAACQEMKPKSKPKSRRIAIEEEDEAKEKKEKEKRTERTVDQTAAEKTEKEKEEATEKEEKKFNMHLAQLFFKRMMDAQRTRKAGDQKRDQNLEVMPDRGWISKPKVPRKGPRLPRKPRPLDTTIFKPSGEPVWMEFELQEEVYSANGVKTKTPQLQEALEDSELELDDGKQWVPMIEEYMNGSFDNGKFQFSPDELNPFGTFKELEKRSERYSRLNSIKYYTLKNLLFMSKSAIERSSRLTGPHDQTPIEELRRKEVDTHFQKASKEEEEEKEKEKTCVVTSISFNTESTFSISYDRRRPILSIQKFRKKYQERLRKSIDKKESREGKSKEGASREGKSRENA